MDHSQGSAQDAVGVLDVERALDVEWALVGVLVATKAADVGTTLVGLDAYPGVHESNPVAVAAIERLGVPLALLALSIAVVVLVTVVVEGVAALLVAAGSTPSWGPSAVKLVGYGVAAIVHVAVAAHNAVLLLAA